MATFAPTSLTLRALLKTAAGRAGMGVRASRVSGLTPPAKAMFAASAAARDRVLLVVPTDGDVERMTGDVRFFLTAIEGLSDSEVERAVLPFPSHEVDPYRGLAPHMDIASARARAMHALQAGTARIVIASAAGLLPRVSAPQHVQSTSLTLVPGQEISPVDLGDLLASAGYTRQDPVDESGEFCVRGGVVDFYPAGSTEPVRLEFVGDNIESIRTYDPATQRSTQPLDQAAIVPLQDLLDEGDGLDRSSTAFEYLWAHGRPHVLVSEPDEVHAQGEKLTAQVQASFEEAVSKGNKVPAACGARDRLGRGARVAPRGHRARDARRGRRPGRTAHRVAARAGVRGAHPGLGRRDPPRARARRRRALRRRLTRTRRAHGRTARRLRRLRRAGGPRRRLADGIGARGRRAISRRASGCPRPRCRSGPKPTSSRKSGRPTSAAARRPAPFSPTSATSRSAISSSTSTTGSGCSSGSSASRSARTCRSSWSSGTTARTSCSCRSNGSISSRSTPAARSRRSTGSAGPRGRRRRRASRRRCATWPRSC